MEQVQAIAVGVVERILHFTHSPVEGGYLKDLAEGRRLFEQEGGALVWHAESFLEIVLFVFFPLALNKLVRVIEEVHGDGLDFHPEALLVCLELVLLLKAKEVVLERFAKLD